MYFFATLTTSRRFASVSLRGGLLGVAEDGVVALARRVVALQLATLHALGQADLLFRAEQRHATNLAQVHAYGIVKITVEVGGDRRQPLTQFIPATIAVRLPVFLGRHLSPHTLRRVKRINHHAVIPHLSKDAKPFLVHIVAGEVWLDIRRVEQRRAGEEVLVGVCLFLIIALVFDQRVTSQRRDAAWEQRIHARFRLQILLAGWPAVHERRHGALVLILSLFPCAWPGCRHLAENPLMSRHVMTGEPAMRTGRGA